MGIRRTAAIAAISLALTAPGLVAAPPAAAADTRLTIARIPTVTAPYGKKATIKPKVTRTGQVKLLSKSLTVKQGKRTVVRDKTSAKLKPGTYRVTTKLKYRTYKLARSTKTVKQKVVGVEAWTETRVTCTASSVETYTWGAELDATCTGTAFDGTFPIRGLSVFGEPGDYTGYTDNYDSLDFAWLPSPGEKFSATLMPADDIYRTTTVRRTTTRKVWSGTKVKSRTQNLIVKAGKRPSRTTPDAWGECPGWAPIKGNRGSYDWIYHVPGSTYYSRTIAEECFTTRRAAENAGYRAPLR